MRSASWLLFSLSLILFLATALTGCGDKALEHARQQRDKAVEKAELTIKHVQASRDNAEAKVTAMRGIVEEAKKEVLNARLAHRRVSNKLESVLAELDKAKAEIKRLNAEIDKLRKKESKADS